MTSNARSHRACEPCRQRKIKCDCKVPVCTRCLLSVRNARKCFYRQDRLDLVLRNESEAVRRRYEDRDDLPQSTADSHIFSTGSAPQSSSDLSIVRPMVGDLAIQAGTHVLLARFEHGVYFQYLPAIYSSYPSSKILTMSVGAVGLRCISLARNESRLLQKARENHTLALRVTNQHIASLAYQDAPYDMMAAVMLLALFAVMSSDSFTALDVWTKHVDGVLAILTAWFSQQTSMRITTLAGQNLLGHVINCVQTSCLQRRKRLSETLRSMYEHLPEDNLQARLHNTINYLARLKEEPPKTTWDISIHLRHLYKLDKDLLAILAFLQKSQPFEVLPNTLGRPNEPVCYRYRSHRAAQSWNLVRIVRLTLHESLLALLTSRAETEQDGESVSVELIRDTRKIPSLALSAIASLAFDMYASVPSWLRQQSSDDGQKETLHVVHPDALHWAHSMIWPLATVQACPYTPKRLLTLIDDTLRNLWQATTFPGAIGPEKQQVEGMELRDWAHVFFWC